MIEDLPMLEEVSREIRIRIIDFIMSMYADKTPINDQPRGDTKRKTGGFATVNNEYMLHQLPDISCQNCPFLPSHLISSLRLITCVF